MDGQRSSIKRYCHNDVLAMIMAFDLVEYLLKSKNIYFKNFETYKDLKAKNSEKSRHKYVVIFTWKIKIIEVCF